jgi:hypothetical protein
MLVEKEISVTVVRHIRKAYLVENARGRIDVPGQTF